MGRVLAVLVLLSSLALLALPAFSYGGCNNSTTSLTVTTPPSPTLFNNGVFIIGVDGIRMDHASTWISNGINTQVSGPAGDQSFYTYLSMYNALHAMMPSMNFIPGTTNAGNSNWITAGLSVPHANLFCLAQPDEPNVNGITMSQLQSYYNAFKTSYPTVPIFLNYGGADQIMYGAYTWTTALQYGDWYGTDTYPYTACSWCGCLIGDSSAVGQAMDSQYYYLQQTQIEHPGMNPPAQDRPLFAYVEMVNITGADPNVGGPTGTQVATMMWNAVIHGARGIAFWDYNVSLNVSSLGPAGVQTAIQTTSAWMQSIGTVIQDTIIRPTQTGAAGPCNWTTRPWMGQQYIVHIGGRITPSGNWYFIQNTSNTTSFSGSISLPQASGTVTSARRYSAQNTWTTISVSNGSITETLVPNAIYVYQLL